MVVLPVLYTFLGWTVIPLLLAFKGNEWAWQNKRWESVEHFKRVQHIWTMWGWGLTIATTVFIVIIAVYNSGPAGLGHATTGVKLVLR